MAVFSPEDLKWLQDRINRTMDEFRKTDLESSPEFKKVQDQWSRLMEDFRSTALGRDTSIPLADLLETDEALIVRMDLPGVQKEDVELVVSEDLLKLTAKRSIEPERDADLLKGERNVTFRREMTLPVTVMGDEARAKLKDGVLEIALPKEVVTSKKRITIE
ncbi:MAG: Hsp20/alpha crystallin family protein [Methanosarcinales archaeon]|nr:Hsp20/alpha crystallin family protein [Methanosarcinales archaeon]